MPTDVGGLPVGPGAFEQGASGVGVAGVGDRPLPAARPTGIVGGEQARIFQQWPGVVEAGEVAEFGDGGDSHRPLHATEGLERFHNGGKPPGVDVFVACVCQPLAPFGVFGPGPDLCVKDAGLRGGGPHDLAEPTQGRWAPGGPAGRAAILPEPTGVEATFGRCQIVERSCTRTAQVTHGFGCDRGDIGRRERTGAPQPGPLDGIPTIGGDAVASLLGDSGGGDDPAVVAFLGQRAGEPGPTGSRCLDADQVWGVGLQRAHELIKVALPRANGAQIDDRSLVSFGDVGHGDGVLADSQPTLEWARVRQG
jgi:hypothetical protein